MMHQTDVILAIDPGKHIGYAIFGIEESRVLQSGMILSEDLHESILSDFKLVRPLYRVVEVVIEEFPTTASRELFGIRAQLLRYFPDAKFIYPGVYLPVMQSRDIPFKSTNIHTREAALLAYYFYTFKFRKDDHGNN